MFATTFVTIPSAIALNNIAPCYFHPKRNDRPQLHRLKRRHCESLSATHFFMCSSASLKIAAKLCFRSLAACLFVNVSDPKPGIFRRKNPKYSSAHDLHIKLGHAGPTSVSRAAEPKAPSRVACSDLAIFGFTLDYLHSFTPVRIDLPNFDLPFRDSRSPCRWHCDPGFRH
jgi:hypothetical protein